MIRRSISIPAVLFLLFLSCILLNAEPQGFFTSDLTLHSTVTTSGGRGAGKPTTSTTFFSGDAIKTSGSDGNDVILRLDQQKMISVDNNKKTYTEITFQQLEQMAGALNAAMGDKENAEAMQALRKVMGGGGAGEIAVSKVGPGENIAGYATEKYLVKGPMEMQIWAAPSLKVPAQYFDAMKSRMPRNPMFDMGKIFDEMKKINGMPMKQVVTVKMMGMEMTTTTVVDSVEKSPVPKSVFDIPAGYRKVDFDPGK